MSLPIRTTKLSIAGVTYTIERPASASDLLDRPEYQQDDRAPYWAELWPAGVALAEYLATLDGNGRTLLELGCGLGLASVVAARRGFRVTATDLHPESLGFTRGNASQNNVELTAVGLDWRSFDDLSARYEVVVAADVLYEPEACCDVAKFLAVATTPNGLAIVADPQRGTAADFRAACATEELTVETLPPLPYLHAQAVGTGRDGQLIDFYLLRHSKS